MKKIIALLLAALMLVSILTACGKPEETPGEETQETIPGTEPETPIEPETPVEPEAPVVPETPTVPEAPVTEENELPVVSPEGDILSDPPANPPAASGSVEMELSAIVDAMYAKYDPMLPVGTIPVDLADEFSRTSYTGLTDASMVKEAVASESMIGSQAYSVVLVRLNNAADAEAVASAMKSGIDPRKWICVEADTMRVVSAGDVVMLVMISSALDVKVDAVVDAFAAVIGQPFTVDLR